MDEQYLRTLKCLVDDFIKNDDSKSARTIIYGRTTKEGYSRKGYEKDQKEYKYNVINLTHPLNAEEMNEITMWMSSRYPLVSTQRDDCNCSNEPYFFIACKFDDNQEPLTISIF